MHIVFVDRSGADSIWELMNHIAVSCIAQGGRVTFVIFDDGREAYGHAVPDGVEVYTIHVPVKKRLWGLIPQHIIFVREFRKLLRKIKPDIVHTNFAVPSIIARWVAFHEKVPCIISTQHELYGSMYFHYRWGLRLTEHYCSAITYVSETVAHSFKRKSKKNIDAHTVFMPAHIVIPNGVDVDKIRATIATAPNRVAGKIVCAGRMVPVKGQELLLVAFKNVAESHPHVSLTLIGSGPMASKLRCLTSELGLGERVHFTGWIPHEKVLGEMASAELVIVPSDGSQEGFGLVVAEALVCGSRLLVSDIPVFREVLEHFSKSVHYFIKNDVESLVNEMKSIFSNEKMSEEQVTFSHVEDFERISSTNMADHYLQLYKYFHSQT